MKTLTLSLFALAITATSALAGGDPTDCFFDSTLPGCPNAPVAVPEISALEGTAALAALAAVLFIAWERRRRAV